MLLGVSLFKICLTVLKLSKLVIETGATLTKKLGETNILNIVKNVLFTFFTLSYLTTNLFHKKVNRQAKTKFKNESK